MLLRTDEGERDREEDDNGMEGTLDGRQKGNEMQTKMKQTVSKPTYAKRETDRVTQ